PDLSPTECGEFLQGDRPPAALVVEPSSAPDLWNEMRTRGWNVWSILDFVEDGNCVYIAHERAGYLAARYLLTEGCMNIALLNGPINSFWGFKARFTGYKRALAEFDVPYRPELALEGEHAVDSEAGRAMMRELLASGHEFDGVIGVSDGKAIGAMMAAD